MFLPCFPAFYLGYPPCPKPDSLLPPNPPLHHPHPPPFSVSLFPPPPPMILQERSCHLLETGIIISSLYICIQVSQRSHLLQWPVSYWSSSSESFWDKFPEDIINDHSTFYLQLAICRWSSQKSVLENQTYKCNEKKSFSKFTCYCAQNVSLYWKPHVLRAPVKSLLTFTAASLL